MEKAAKRAAKKEAKSGPNEEKEASLAFGGDDADGAESA